MRHIWTRDEGLLVVLGFTGVVAGLVFGAGGQSSTASVICTCVGHHGYSKSILCMYSRKARQSILILSRLLKKTKQSIDGKGMNDRDTLAMK